MTNQKAGRPRMADRGQRHGLVQSVYLPAEIRDRLRAEVRVVSPSNLIARLLREHYARCDRAAKWPEGGEA